MSVIVFGSINMDLVVRTPRFPQPGETISGSDFYTAPGGKGANQAVAAGRMQAPVYMIGRVGGDVFGQALLDSLSSNGVEYQQCIRSMKASRLEWLSSRSTMALKTTSLLWQAPTGRSAWGMSSAWKVCWKGQLICCCS
jgi:hypothetical protein